MKLTARSRLETYASLSRTQSDEETYGLRMEPSVLASGDSVGAGGDGAVGSYMDAVEHDARERRLEMSDKHVTPTEVLDCLRFVRTHLYAAQAQAVPGDDTIITRHVYDAYKRVSDVCREIEINGIGIDIPAVYHINRTPLGIEGPFRLLVAACNRLQAEAEEYQFGPDIGPGAAFLCWHEFYQALERATEALKDE